MVVSVAFVLAGVALLYGGAESLVRGSVALATRIGLTPLVIGLTVVAFGTSTPELVVSVSASLQNSGSIAAGNVVGSNIANIALILSISILIRPTGVRAQIFRVEAPIVILVSLLVVSLLWDGAIGQGSGAGLFALLVVYIAFSIRRAKMENRMVEMEYEESIPEPTRSIWIELGMIVGGLGLLMFGARLMVAGAVTIAEEVGISEAVIGLSVVSIGTSLPELATSAVAAFRNQGDIAVGNIVGSNLFNLLGLLGLSALARPIQNADVGLVSFAVMVLLSLVLVPLMRSGTRLSRPEGAVLLTSYVAYLIYLAGLPT